MSGGLDILGLKTEDVTKMLTATTHLGSEKVDFQMEQYVYKRRPDGVHIINLGRTWEKLQLAARAIAAIEHPQDVSISNEYIPPYTCVMIYFYSSFGAESHDANSQSETKTHILFIIILVIL